MLLTWTPQAWADYLYWQATDKRTVKRINELLRDALHEPFKARGASSIQQLPVNRRELMGFVKSL